LGDVFRESAPSASGTSAAATEQKEAALTEAANQLFASQPSATSTPHPTKAAPGEELPEGFTRSYAGFLLRNVQREIEVDQDIVKEEMEYLTQFLSIFVCFVGGALPQASIPQWLNQLQRDTRCPLSFGRALGKGFYTIKTTDPEAVRNLMLLSSY
jgi:hypothetical protein